MGTGFQRYVGGRAFCSLTGRTQGKDFSMGLTGTVVESLADNFFAVSNYTPHIGVWGCRVLTALCQSDGTMHHGMVIR